MQDVVSLTNVYMVFKKMQMASQPRIKNIVTNHVR